MRIVFMGSPEDVIAPAAYLKERGTPLGFDLIGVVSQPARPVGRSSHLQDPPVAAWAKQEGLICLQPESAKSEDFQQALRDLKPDVLVTAAYGQILSETFLQIPTRATINIHPSRLPEYRGATPVPAALLDERTTTAVTVLFTVKKLDAGNIILCRDFAISSEETAGQLTARLFHESGPLLIQALDKLRDTQFVGTPQDDARATFCKKIDKESGLIDWSLPASQIVARFRAYEPWPGSWTFLGDRRIGVTNMRVASGTNSAAPGEFTWDKPSKSLRVNAGKDAVAITGVKPAGGKAMDAAGFWNGVQNKVPHRFQNESQTS